MLSIAAVSLTACRRDMQDQPRYKPLQPGNFFTDGRSARPIPSDTVAIDELNNGDSVHTGYVNGQWAATIPLPLNLALLQRGHERFDIFCSPCHGRLGDGDGMVAQRGVRAPVSFHTDRVRNEPPGYIFDVITHGFGAMEDYGDQVPVDDRWAIIAYIRALELSRMGTIGDVPAAQRGALEAKR
ncbi:MAG TPA: cytochrome c [Bryobacteraceae bacterium]|nr:cytochrome c [Bryobacteraceae bacterium]